jgi:hypothetical protein
MMKVIGNGVLFFETENQEQFAHELSDYIGANRHVRIITMVGDEHIVYNIGRKYTVVVEPRSKADD